MANAGGEWISGAALGFKAARLRVWAQDHYVIELRAGGQHFPVGGKHATQDDAWSVLQADEKALRADAYALWQAHLKRRAPNTQRRQRPGVAAAAIANELDTDSKENEGKDGAATSIKKQDVMASAGEEEDVVQVEDTDFYCGPEGPDSDSIPNSDGEVDCGDDVSSEDDEEENDTSSSEDDTSSSEEAEEETTNDS